MRSRGTCGPRSVAEKDRSAMFEILPCGGRKRFKAQRAVAGKQRFVRKFVAAFNRNRRRISTVAFAIGISRLLKNSGLNCFLKGTAFRPSVRLFQLSAALAAEGWSS